MDITKPGEAQGRAVDAGRGVSWWSEGWALLMRNAGNHVLLSLVLCVIVVVLSIIPVVGSLALSLLFPVFVGSWMLIARKLEAGGAAEIGDLFLGFKDKLTPLLILGGLVLGATVVLMVLFFVLGVGAAFGGSAAGFGAVMLMTLIGLAYGFVVGLAMLFAPALVVFQDMPPIDALKTSFAAGLKNLIAFIVFGVLYIVAAIIASIPLGLGWLVLVPVWLFAIYRAYVDVFGR